MDLSQLNPQQQHAIVSSMNVPTVVLAGAGSGKTKVLTYRAGYLLDDMNVDPESIVAVTFTNKAAGEIRDRLAKITPHVDKIWLGTFHSICVRLLHMFGKEMNLYSFTIMDSSDAKSVLRQALKDNNMAVEKQIVNTFMSKISQCKSNLVNPKAMLTQAQDQWNLQFCRVYQTYQNLCWAQRALDFDDLIVFTVLLLQRYPNVKAWVDTHLLYLMVDESQDTNPAQFELIKLLIGNRNLFMVGKIVAHVKPREPVHAGCGVSC